MAIDFKNWVSFERYIYGQQMCQKIIFVGETGPVLHFVDFFKKKFLIIEPILNLKVSLDKFYQDLKLCL